MSAGWHNKITVVNEARLNDEIRKRGLRISALEERLGAINLILGKDWRGRYAQDLATELLGVLQ